MCGNLLERSPVGYSYGISGYDKWGCDISTKHRRRLHQYDCFNTRSLRVRWGHGISSGMRGRRGQTRRRPVFDTIANQFAKRRQREAHRDEDRRRRRRVGFAPVRDGPGLSADRSAGRLSFTGWRTRDRAGSQDDKHLRVVRRLKQFFEIAHIHFNNSGVRRRPRTIPSSWTYEVLFVSKRLAVVDPTRKPGGLHPLATPNDPRIPECLPATARRSAGVRVVPLGVDREVRHEHDSRVLQSLCGRPVAMRIAATTIRAG